LCYAQNHFFSDRGCHNALKAHAAIQRV
jgi:hypothetical protein